jgi:N,N-dimethylformamidase
MTTLVGDQDLKRSIVGYCWPWTVRPGERVDFMVSIESNGERYRADLVRLICAESLSDPKMFKEKELQAPFAGSHVGYRQETHVGSYVEIAASPVLDQLRSFTVQAMVMPTLLPASVRLRQGGPPVSPIEEITFQDQHLVSRWDNSKRRGWALVVDAHGHPVFVCGDGESMHRTTLPRALVPDQWFFIMAAFDAENRRVSIYARPFSRFASANVSWLETRVNGQHEDDLAVIQKGPLRFAACTDGPGNATRLKPACCFNGRLDSVRLSAGALSDSQAFDLAAGAIPDALAASVVGFWDFGRAIDSIEVHDLSTNRLNGETVNLPMRGVIGVDWDNSVTDWRHRPDHYSAIHFHDDDLYDAEWKADFSYTVPPDLASGVYAARLRYGSFDDYIPFFVAPPQGKATARAALLIPTATYTAYTNVTGLTQTAAMRKRQFRDRDGQVQVIEEDPFSAIRQTAADATFLLQNIRTLGKGIYANHSDGTLFGVASQRHPNMTIKPKGIQWTLVADSLITDWLENAGIEYDIITDELLHREGIELLRQYRVVMTGNHPEYYSKAMLDAVAEYLELGGRLMYLGGNGFWYATSFHQQLPGAIEARKDVYSGHWKPYEIRHAFDGIQGGFWEKNGRPPQLLVGVGISELTGFAFEGSAPYRRLAGSYDARAAFIFQGVRHDTFGDYGILGGGAAGQEFDRVSAELGTPAHALHLARADQFASYVSMLDEAYALNAAPPFGDVVYFETARGGGVFSAGSMAWVGSLSHNNYDNDVARITGNVLCRFLDDAPIVYPGALESHNSPQHAESLVGDALSPNLARLIGELR